MSHISSKPAGQLYTGGGTKNKKIKKNTIKAKIINSQLKPVTVMDREGRQMMNSVLSTEEQKQAVEMRSDSVYTV